MAQALFRQFEDLFFQQRNGALDAEILGSLGVQYSKRTQKTWPSPVLARPPRRWVWKPPWRLTARFCGASRPADAGSIPAAAASADRGFRLPEGSVAPQHRRFAGDV